MSTYKSGIGRWAFPFLLLPAAVLAGRVAAGQMLTQDGDATTPAEAQLSAAGDEAMVPTSLPGMNVAPGQKPEVEDLTLGNFFSDGWDDDFTVRKRDTGTPDLPLLRVQYNNMLRLFRGNFFEETDLASSTKKNLTDFDGFIDWGFNRRFQIEVNDAYQWIDPRTGSPTASGGAPGLAARVEMIDTESSSICLNVKAVGPNFPLGATQTTLSYGLAGFEDLSAWLPVDRVALYYSFTFDSYLGPAAATAKHTDIQYDVSLAKTLTAPDDTLGSLTVFVENFAQTDLDGSEDGRTLLTITPGLRFNFGPGPCAKMGGFNALVFGTDIPVSEYRPWDAIYRLSYIKCL